MATAFEAAAQVTVVGMRAGGPHFGTSPGDGELYATCRAHADDDLARLADRCRELGRGIAAAHGVDVEFEVCDEFPATNNDPGVVEVVDRAARSRGLTVRRLAHPIAWSEDFGHFTARAPGALFGLGSGLDQPNLHHADYDFPDSLIEIGAGLFLAALPELLGG